MGEGKMKGGEVTLREVRGVVLERRAEQAVEKAVSEVEDDFCRFQFTSEDLPENLTRQDLAKWCGRQLERFAAQLEQFRTAQVPRKG